MTAISYDGALPTIGADADTWGAELNDGALTKIKADLDMLNASPTGRILGRVTALTGEVERLTPTEAATLIQPVVGATQSVAGLQGSVPAPAAGDQYKVLAGGGTFQRGIGRAFGCILTSTDVVGTTPTITGALNIASSSTITDAGTRRIVTLTFTNPMPDTSYGVHVTMNKTSPGGHVTAYGAKTTTTVVVIWDIGAGADTEITVSGF